MASTRKSDKWLLIQWGCGSRDVVNLKSVISPTSEARVGTVVIADKGNGSHEAATVIGTSRDRQLLERQISPKAEAVEEDQLAAAGPSNEEPRDFSASASSWEPSDENPSSDEEVEQKKAKQERFSRSYTNRRSSKVLKPTHRADAINAIFAKSRKRTIEDTKCKDRGNNMTDKKSLPDSTRKNNSPAPNPKTEVVSINVRDIMDMKQCFHELFSLIKELKPAVPTETKLPHNNNRVNTPIKPIIKPENNILHEYNDEHDLSSRSEDLNRSDDNVLITNKYANANNKVLTEKDKNQNEKAAEWIPIGSGKTLIHKDQYRKVNWKSYTIATRTLLLAVFPRRILATHSLTGKRSPAFQDKPAKMCLDPKIVTDVIIEITDRFKVKENLVRSIITTKCADECKMYKTRQKQIQKRKTLPTKQERKDIKMDIEDGEANQTC